MVTVNVYAAKTHLSRLLKRVSAGEEVIIAEAGKPVARIVPLESRGPRVLGGDEGTVWVADDFDAALSDDLIDTFYGGRPGRAPRATRKRVPARKLKRA